MLDDRRTTLWSLALTIVLTAMPLGASPWTMVGLESSADGSLGAALVAILPLLLGLLAFAWTMEAQRWGDLVASGYGLLALVGAGRLLIAGSLTQLALIVTAIAGLAALVVLATAARRLIAEPPWQAPDRARA